jgi:hypothetical protein
LLSRQLPNRATFAVILISGHGDVPLAVETVKLAAKRDLEHDGEKLEIHGRIAALSNHDLCHLPVKLPTQAAGLTFGLDGKLTRHVVT